MFLNVKFVYLSLDYYIVCQYIGLNIIKCDKWRMNDSISNWIENKCMWMKVYDVMVVI